MKDYRIQDPTLRREYFDQYFLWSLRTYDCDPAMFLLNYIYKRLELNTEQRYWMAWLYANTYQLATAWVIANEFPDFENVDLERLIDWNKKNYKRLRYQADNKWSKGHLPEMFKSYRDEIYSNAKNQEEYFKKICIGTSTENFKSLYSIVTKKFYKFGRYTAWFYLQALKETCGLDVEPDNLLLSDENTHTQRGALCYIHALDEIACDKKKNREVELVKKLEKTASDIISKFNNQYPELKCDMFLLETCLCAFKKTFRKKRGRYLWYYLD